MNPDDLSVPVTDDDVASSTPPVSDVSSSTPADDDGVPIVQQDSAEPPVVQSAPVPVFVSAAPPVFDPHSADEIGFLRTVLGPRAWAAHRARTQAKLDRIMVLAHEKGQIDRKDVRNLLNCSKPACTRHLTALVRQGKLTRYKVLDDMVYRVTG